MKNMSRKWVNIMYLVVLALCIAALIKVFYVA